MPTAALHTFWQFVAVAAGLFVVGLSLTLLALLWLLILGRFRRIAAAASSGS